MSKLKAADGALFTPRDYQADALDSVERGYKRGSNRQLIFWATGAGKTVFALHLPQRFPEHVRKHGFLFLAHRRKILFQAYEKFKAAYPNMWIGLEMGEHEAVGMEDMIFMSVDSVGREYQMRINKYKNRDFGVIVADEGHHVTKESTWDRILNYFGVGSNPSKRRIEVGGSMVKPLSIFLTATPNRADEHSIAPFVDRVASRFSIIDGIKQGWLTDIKAHQAYPKGESRIPEGQEVAYLVKTLEEYLEGHRTLVFASNVEESESLSYHLNQHDIARAAHIDHLTPDEERHRIYKGFQDGSIDVLSNRLVLTEGFNNRHITAILDNAPTERKPLHIQKCLDEQTEILTRDGFKGPDELTFDDEVAGFDTQTEEIRWVDVLRKIDRPADPSEKMVSYESDYVNFRMTDDHRMFVKYRGGYENGWKEVFAKEFHERVSRQKIPVAGHEKVGGIDYSDEELWLSGFWVGDGTFNCRAATFSQSERYEENIEKLLDCFESLGFDYKRYEYPKDSGYETDYDRFNFSISTEDTNSIRKLLKKEGPKILENATKEQFECFLRGLNDADGNKSKKIDWTRQGYTITSGNKKLADFIQSLGVRRGWRVNITKQDYEYWENPIWMIYAKDENTRTVTKTKGRRQSQIEDSKGERVWCVTNELGSIVIRRNGKTMIVGNCGRGLRPHPSANVDAYDTAEERRAAIRASTKPYLTYVSTFDPTKHGLDVAAELIGLDQPIDAEGSLIVEEVVDVVEEFEADLEEIPLEDYGSISELEVALRGANLFTQTVNNDEVKALTDLCWVNRGDSMHLFLPENPFASGTYSTAPTVVTFRKTPNGIERETVTGGWNGKRPLSKRRYETQVDAPTLNKAVRQFDSQLRRRDSEIYKRVTRGGSQPASDRMKTYLDNKGVSYTGMLSEEAALLMIADCKIKQWRDE